VVILVSTNISKEEKMKKNCRKYVLLFLISGVLLMWRPVFCADWYVNPGANPGGDGTSWTKAFQSLQQAVNAAASIWMVCMAPPDTIHV
jgi:hypothetical protein